MWLQEADRVQSAMSGTEAIELRIQRSLHLSSSVPADGVCCHT